MNHDATHCLDYGKGCSTKECYRAELTADLRKIHYFLPISWAHYEGTSECPRCKEKRTRNE